MTTDEKPNAKFRLGVVSFLNAQPLVHGLAQRDDISLIGAVPARLGAMLDAGILDAALTPSVDFTAPNRDWLMLSAGCIASHGEVLTVRLFAQSPLEQLQHIACDTDSHTSVALLETLWPLQFGRPAPALEPLCGQPTDHQAVLLIGDKVVRQLGRWAHEWDLGQAWTQETSLPFVYAVWAARPGADVAALETILENARRAGVEAIEQIAQHHGPAHGFDTTLAVSYLRQNIRFDFGPAERAGLERFLELRTLSATKNVETDLSRRRIHCQVDS